MVRAKQIKTWIAAAVTAGVISSGSILGMGQAPAASQQHAAAASPKLVQPAKPLLPEDLWHDLASSEEATVRRAMETLQNAPAAEVVAFLKQRLQPIKVDEKRINHLIAELDNRELTRRRQAAEELEYLGPSAEPFIEQALKSFPPLEVRRRLEQLLARYRPMEVAFTQEELMARQLQQFRQIRNPNIDFPRPRPRVDIDVVKRPSVKVPPNGLNPALIKQPKDALDPAVAIKEPGLNGPNGRIYRETATSHFVIPPPSPFWLRAERAIHLLQGLDRQDAKDVLKGVSGGVEGMGPTMAARVALGMPVPEPAPAIADINLPQDLEPEIQYELRKVQN